MSTPPPDTHTQNDWRMIVPVVELVVATVEKAGFSRQDTGDRFTEKQAARRAIRQLPTHSEHARTHDNHPCAP